MPPPSNPNTWASTVPGTTLNPSALSLSKSGDPAAASSGSSSSKTGSTAAKAGSSGSGSSGSPSSSFFSLLIPMGVYLPLGIPLWVFYVSLQILMFVGFAGVVGYIIFD
jgi:hypothetical protein